MDFKKKRYTAIILISISKRREKWLLSRISGLFTKLSEMDWEKTERKREEREIERVSDFAAVPRHFRLRKNICTHNLLTQFTENFSIYY